MISNIDNINPYILYCGYLNETVCPPPGTEYRERQVKWYEIEFITWGTGKIITEGKIIPAEKGAIFFRKPGMIVRGISPYHCYSIIFDMIYEKSKYDIYCSDKNFYNDDTPYRKFSELESDNTYSGFGFPHAMKTNRYNMFEELFLNVFDEYLLNGVSRQFFLKTYLMQILMLTYNELSLKNAFQQQNLSLYLNYPKVMAVKNHIDNNFRSGFKLENLASLANLSPNFFCKIFKRIIGETPINYINKKRVFAAKRRLLETNDTIKEISYWCGFDNETYFCTLFKKLEGITPLQYRVKHRMLYYVNDMKERQFL